MDGRQGAVQSQALAYLPQRNVGLPVDQGLHLAAMFFREEGLSP